MDMNIPAFRTFEVDESITDYFDKYFVKVKETDKGQQEVSCTTNGYQSDNVLGYCDQTFRSHVDLIIDKISDFGLQVKPYWVHYIEYYKGGYQIKHNHTKVEDYSCILYLNDCDDGHTVFEIGKNILHDMKPKRNKACLFVSSINHSGNKSEEGKKVIVFGFMLKRILP